MVANNAVVFARQIIKAAMDRRHSWQVVENFLDFLDDFLEGKIRETLRHLKGMCDPLKHSRDLYTWALPLWLEGR